MTNVLDHLTKARADRYTIERELRRAPASSEEDQDPILITYSTSWTLLLKRPPACWSVHAVA